MPSPTTPTIKQLIIAEMKAAFGAITGVAGVIGVDAAALEQGSRDPSWAQKIMAGTKEGSYVFEMDFSPDEAVEPESSGSRAFAGVDKWDFEAVAMIHLPDPLPFIDPDQEGLGRITAVAAAEAITGAVYAIAGTIAPTAAGQQTGRWYYLAEGGDDQPLAEFTTVQTKGGVALSDLETRVTFVRLVTRYRTAKGDAGVRA
jgi:hypothetical protein